METCRHCGMEVAFDHGAWGHVFVLPDDTYYEEYCRLTRAEPASSTRGPQP